MAQSQNLEENSLFRIMIATDNHLGHLENDQIRGDDSFISFEEILKLSKTENVDFLLLGGDMFHHHNPTKKTIIRASNILQKHVYGQKEHQFEVFCYEPNFKNENLSIELPIFIIHGNHDDPSGFENFSSIDIFSNKEVNYFGKVNNYEEFDLYPILFVKGATKIALYGIGNIKDERLYLALQNKKVNFHRPDDYKNWFNILIVHQNRFKGHHTGKNKKNYLPESFIPSFFDLVVWGHEHESFTEPVYNNEVGFHIYQPGSSVVTSLIQAESKPKHIGILEVNLDRFRIVPVKLESVRPFVFQQFELKSFAHRIEKQDDVEKIIEEKIDEMLLEAESFCRNLENLENSQNSSENNNNITENIQGQVGATNNNYNSNINLVNRNLNLNNKNNNLIINHNNLNNKNLNNNNHNNYSKMALPIIRLKIEFSGYQITRTNFIVSKFGGRIANPGEVIQFYKKGDVFAIKRSNNTHPCGGHEMEVDDNDGSVGNIEEEMLDNNHELTKFVNQSFTSYFVDQPHKKTYFNSDFFCDSLEKSVNGQERRSLELFFKNFYDNVFHSVKFEEHKQILKELTPLENTRKDFSNIMEDLIDKEEINSMILNNIRNKRNTNSIVKENNNRNSYNVVNNNLNNNIYNDMNNNFVNKFILPAAENKNRQENDTGFKLLKTNDFQNEKRENKNSMIIDSDNISQHSFNFEPTQNDKNKKATLNLPKMQNKQITQKTRKTSILDYIGKNSRNSNSNNISNFSNDSNFDIKDEVKLFDDAQLDLIDEESEYIFKNETKVIGIRNNKRNFDKNVSEINSNNNNIKNVNMQKSGKRKHFKFEEKKKEIRKQKDK